MHQELCMQSANFTAELRNIWKWVCILDDSGKPIVRAFILEKEEVEILDSLNYMEWSQTGKPRF